MAEGGRGQRITIEHHYHLTNEGDRTTIGTNIGQQTNISGEIEHLGITAPADIRQDGVADVTGRVSGDSAQQDVGASSKREPSTSAAKQGDATKAQSEELPKGYIRISDDTVMYNVAPIREGTNIFKGHQEHVSEDGSLKKLPVAIKRIIPSTPKHRAEVQHLLTLASHPNIVRIIRSKEHKEKFGNVLFIVMELCSLQNLSGYLRENRENGTPFDFKKTLKFTKQLVKGMKHIHDNGIVHRDVKPENILLSADKTQLKFTDFGIGKKLRQGLTSTKGTGPGQGTTGYMAPETHSSDKVSKSGDIFSLGVTLFELWSNGLNPYGLDIVFRDINIITNKAPDFSGLLIAGPLGSALLDLIKRMLQHDPCLRPTIDEVQKDIFFINAKIKSGEGLLLRLNLGTRTPSDVESIRKQSETTDQKQLAITSSDQPKRTESTLQNQAETTDQKQLATTSSDQPERAESTLQNQAETTEETKGATTPSDQPERTESTQNQAETTDQKQLATTSSDQPERTESTLQNQADARPKTRIDALRKMFEDEALENKGASSVQVARIEENLSTASNANQQERSGSAIPKKIETTDQKQLATTSSDQPERTESTLQKQAVARIEEKLSTASNANQQEQSGSAIPREIETVDLLERLPHTQDQQMKLLECYVQLGRISEVLKCIENMRNLVARHPRPKAVDVYQLGLVNFENSYHIKAIAYFACAAKIYSFESDADKAVRRMYDCSYKSSDAVLAMLEQGGMRAFARDVGMEIMNSIYCDVTKMSNANPDLKAEMEARCLNDTGFCYNELELNEKAIEVCERGIDIMNRQFGENSSKYQDFGHLLNNMGAANDNLGNYSEAESLFERSIDAYKRVQGWEDDEAKKRAIGRAENNLHEARREKK